HEFKVVKDPTKGKGGDDPCAPSGVVSDALFWMYGDGRPSGTPDMPDLVTTANVLEWDSAEYGHNLVLDIFYVQPSTGKVFGWTSAGLCHRQTESLRLHPESLLLQQK
ncbi:hypothetical protein HDU84_001349, partial [Entophlyctis sp. JEL0112]